jgi:hypothetical protein
VVLVTLIRDDKEKVVSVTLKNKEGNTKFIKNESVALLGAEFQPLSQEEQDKLNVTGGVKITRLNGGKLRSAGIREGFIITSIDKKNIRNTDDLVAVLDNKKGGVLIEGIYPNGNKAYYGFGL